MDTTNQDPRRGLDGLNVLDLPPSLMIAAVISMKGGQRYQREDEQKLNPLKDGEKRSRWVTKKVIDNEDEFAEAQKLSKKAKYALGKLGRHIPAGMIVSLDRADEVKAYRDEWRAAFQEFNSRSQYTKLYLDFWVNRVMGDNVDNLNQILDELREGLEELEEAYKTVKPDAIRDVVTRMAGFTELLPERVALTLDKAVQTAKKRADSISRGEKRVQRMQARIAEVLGPDADLQQELERLASQPLTADIVNRTKRLTRLSSDVEAATQQLEKAKQVIDETPIQLARFAVRRKRPTDEAVAANQTAGEELLGADLAARARRVQRPVETTTYRSRSGGEVLD